MAGSSIGHLAGRHVITAYQATPNEAKWFTKSCPPLPLYLAAMWVAGRLKHTLVWRIFSSMVNFYLLWTWSSLSQCCVMITKFSSRFTLQRWVHANNKDGALAGWCWVWLTISSTLLVSTQYGCLSSNCRKDRVWIFAFLSPTQRIKPWLTGQLKIFRIAHQKTLWSLIRWSENDTPLTTFRIKLN